MSTRAALSDRLEGRESSLLANGQLKSQADNSVSSYMSLSRSKTVQEG